METIKFKIVGDTIVLMHSAEKLADPLNAHTKLIKEISSKRNKTEKDHMDMSRLEWEAGIYYDEDIGPYFPAVNVEACLRSAAKLSRLGKAVERAIFVQPDLVALDYDGPRKINELFYENSPFIDKRAINVKTSKVMRTRPKFPAGWSMTFTVSYMADIITKDQLILICKTAGRLIGMGDYRPRFGRFTVANH